MDSAEIGKQNIIIQLYGIKQNNYFVLAKKRNSKLAGVFQLHFPLQSVYTCAANPFVLVLSGLG